MQKKKALDKIQHLFMISKNNILGIEENVPNMTKALHEKPNANIILNGKRLKVFLQNQEQDKDACFFHFYAT
jgi:hypothetical protein